MKKYLAELIGTFALVFCGTGAIIINQQSGGIITHAGIAITFGLIVSAMIYTLGEISGAHFNPAVTFAFWIAKKFPGKEVVPYFLSQAVGAFVASLTLKFLFPENETLGSTLPNGSPLTSFVLELILTFILMFVIIHVASGSKEQGMFAGIAIGSVVLLEAMFAGPISGASMNPFRSLAPAVVSGHLEHLWVYIFAPIAGAILGVLCWKTLKSKQTSDEELNSKKRNISLISLTSILILCVGIALYFNCSCGKSSATALSCSSSGCGSACETETTDTEQLSLADLKMYGSTNKDTAVVCKLSSNELRIRKETVLAGLKKQLLAKEELPNGFAFKFPGTDQIMDELTSFVKSERACCSFFTFEISAGGNGKDIWLKLTGPKGAKEMIEAELGL
ncbi:MAG: family channel protein [Bacteroidetes bacterium]|nr:family channel protein [Bacteroidota bacterium]